jgi:hypothetical protein
VTEAELNVTARRKQAKLTPINLEEMEQDPGLRGMLSSRTPSAERRG